MTPAQLSTLATDIAANTATAPGTQGQIKDLAHTADNADAIANWYTATAVPDFWVWRTSVNARQLMSDSAFDWTRVDNLSVGKARIWEFMMMAGTVDPSQPNIRAGFAACFAAVGDAATLAAITSQCRRIALRVEKLLATGTGSTGSPAVMSFEGAISANDIRAIWGI
jgi:hypothetical protein